MGELGTALDTKLEETAPHSSIGSFVYRGFQPFVRLRVAPKLGVLYAKKSEQSPKTLPLKIFGVQLYWNFLTLIGLKYKKFHLDDTL